MGHNTLRAGHPTADGLSLVQSTVEEYMKAFLYSVALAAGVDVRRVDLSPAAAEAAFKMQERWTQ